MSEIEERLRDAFGADADTVRPESLRPFVGRDARGPRPAGGARRGGLMMPLAAAAAVAAIVLGTVFVVPRIWPGSSRTPAGQHRSQGLTRPLHSFLTVTTSPDVIHGDHLVRYAVTTLQLRSVHDGGRVTGTLLHSLGTIDAVLTRNGSVIAVVDHGCRSRVLRIDPRTGVARLIRTIPESAGSIALSPDGRELAYLTYPASDPRPCGPVRQPASPVPLHPIFGGIQYLPSVVAVLDLASGAVVRTAVSNPGQPPSGPSWSPDGTMIAVVHAGEVQIVSAAHPDFATVRRLRPQHGCGYVTSTWTVSGILAVLGCGKQDPALSPRTVVRLSAAGQRTRSWRLPACIDGIHLVADPTASHVLVQADVGYGNGSCGSHRLGGWSTRVAVVRGARLATIAVFRQGGNQLQVTGW